ncbi:MAG: NAD(P)H-dependent oxidoreductase subunit E [Clostridiales bacterium]|jgi:NADH:ubiquinone oxidoreductase subunit E|nr:NAD(P)H-dependent oxidoreductase subunit E [Clostridiales bacterium]
MTNTSVLGGTRAEELDAAIARWKDEKGGLLPIMQQAQDICGCLNEDVQRYISEKTGHPLTTVYGIATFYSQFTLMPRGKYTVGMCMGTACYVRGGANVFTALQKATQVEPGQTTEDGLFTLEAMRCIGCCGLAPAMMVNGEVYGRLTPDDIPGIIEKYRKEG